MFKEYVADLEDLALHCLDRLGECQETDDIRATLTQAINALYKCEDTSKAVNIWDNASIQMLAICTEAQMSL